MELWFTEQHTPNVRFSLKVDKQLFTAESDFQRIDIFESEEVGRVLVLDGRIMLTERDDFIYREMLVHVPMCVNPEIQKVLLVSGSDGGSVSELLRYQSIEQIDLVEQDTTLMRACREFLPLASSLENRRVKIVVCDPLKFVRSKVASYDLIIVDPIDPLGPGEGLFTKEFYGLCFNALKEQGILVNQLEPPFYDAEQFRRSYSRLAAAFPLVRVYQLNMPTFPAGQWLLGYASKNLSPTQVEFRRWEALNLQTNYYNEAIHKASFAVPNYVLESIKSKE